MTRTEFLLKYTDGFNEQQLEAIQTMEGAVLLLAVPGNGKERYSRVLEFRTINGICAKIIGEYGDRIGKKAF